MLYLPYINGVTGRAHVRRSYACRVCSRTYSRCTTSGRTGASGIGLVIDLGLPAQRVCSTQTSPGDGATTGGVRHSAWQVDRDARAVTGQF
jgi:hypothetical protein